jgi:hypothetical protein
VRPVELSIHDAALSPPLFRRLQHAVRGLGGERLRSTYQTTFWFDLKAPRALPEEAALALLSRLPTGRRIVGVEWWLSRMRTTDVQVDFHQDRDERLALRTGRLIHPRWSSVLFLNRCRGGLLAVTDALPEEDNPSKAPDRLDLDLVAPRPNRFAVFAGSLTHGVLDSRNQIPEGARGGTGPLRLAVIFNWWHRRPEEVPAWSETRFYRGLSLAAPGARTRASRSASRRQSLTPTPR